MSIVRTFIAIEIPKTLKQQITELQTELKSLGERISWSKPDSIHLTLKFLGDVDTKKIDAIGEALEQEITPLAAFKFQVEGLGMFPNERRPRVLWVGINDPDHNINELAKKIETSLIQFGFSRENRKFTPHLTLGRVKMQPSTTFLNQLKDTTFEGGQINVDEVILMKSDLKPSGAIYTPLKKIQLK